MHEITIANNLLRQLTKIAQAKQAQLISVNIEIGEFRSIDKECLEFAIDNLKDNYPLLNQCDFKYKIITTLAYCLKNNHLYKPDFVNSFKCNQCDSGITAIIQGEEFNIANPKFSNVVN